MRKLKEVTRENDGKKSQIIEWLSTNSGSIQRNTNIDSQIINNIILDSIFAIYNSP